MSEFFENLKQGLNEAVEYEKNNLSNVKVDKITVLPVHTFSSDEIKQIRSNSNLTQVLFAAIMGVSVKTVEAWESGINTPSGSAKRMLSLLELDPQLPEKYNIISK